MTQQTSDGEAPSAFLDRRQAERDAHGRHEAREHHRRTIETVTRLARDSGRVQLVALALMILTLLVTVLGLRTAVTGSVDSGLGLAGTVAGWFIPLVAAGVGAYLGAHAQDGVRTRAAYDDAILRCYFKLAQMHTIAEHHARKADRPPTPVPQYRAQYTGLLELARQLLIVAQPLRRDGEHAERMRLILSLLEVDPLPHGAAEHLAELRWTMVALHRDLLEQVEARGLELRRAVRLHVQGEDLFPWAPPES